MTRDEYLYLENEVGRRFSLMDGLCARITERLAVGDIAEAQKANAPLHALVAESGKYFDVAAAAMRATLAPPQVPPVPPVEPPVPPPPVPPAPPVDPRLQYDEPTQVVVASIGWAQSLRGYPAQMRMINALQFVAQKSGAVQLHLAEFGSPATTYQAAMSKTPGDLTGASEGNQVSASMAVTAGETYYFNFRAWSRDIGRTATFEVQNVVVEGSWPA